MAIEPITIADVREEMLDRRADDNLVLADLAFTDEDITWGMKACARKFNSLKPYVLSYAWDALPSDKTIFFDGIAWALYRRWRRNVAVNDLDFNAGGLAASVQGTLMKNLTLLVKDLEVQFVESATDMKVIANLDQVCNELG